MKLIVTADDFGASHGITDCILQAHKYGAISCASLLVNGFAADYASKKFEINPGLKPSIHLNLFEGRSISAPKDIYLLVDNGGYFRHTFGSLLISYIFSRNQTKTLMRLQIKHEFEQQIQMMGTFLGEKNIAHVDGHQHVHMLPFVFDALMACYPNPDAILRIPKELFYFAYLRGGKYHLKIFNFVKCLILNYLSRRAYRIARSKKIICTDYFIGVALSGVMNVQAIGQTLDKIRREGGMDSIVEILFHPGHASPEESKLWKHYPVFRKFYCSPYRIDELREVQSTKMRELVNIYRTK